MWWRKKKMTLKHSLRKLVASWKCLNFVEKSKSKSETNPSHYFDQNSLFPHKVGPSCLLERLELCSQLQQIHYFHRLQIILTTVSFTSYWSLYLFWTETNSPLNIPSAQRLDSWRSVMWCYLKFDLSKGVKGGAKKEEGMSVRRESEDEGYCFDQQPFR